MNRCFWWGYDGQGAISRLWTEVLDYLNEAYDMDVVERVYINGDGATWICNGENLKSRLALDKYHMHKYIIAATSHLEDLVEDARSGIYRAIHKKKKWMAKGTFTELSALQRKKQRKRHLKLHRLLFLETGQESCIP